MLELQQPEHPEQPPQPEQPEQQAPFYGPRTLRSYIRDSFRKLNAFEEQQEAHILAYLTTCAPTPTLALTPAPDPNNPRSDTGNTNNSNNTRSFLARGNDLERQNLVTIRRQYYRAFPNALDLINQLPEAQVVARKRYLRHILVRLNRVLDRMNFELTQSKAATAAAGADDNMGLHRTILRMHQDVVMQFARLFREIAAKY
ncbi:hypothetical protein K457DRAFT_16804 [Linnemannia elongata AG-77]|uniref:Uncharacterized protein n=1 Tax=Linnemannia elongata AG-77 TaxID=1314771 RepID=A0A197K350_9FUNG|nr:hypothetical protein K457DRAFT_16804 [Linnemannia elongata AG-77]